jgi:hypothetical protein
MKGKAKINPPVSPFNKGGVTNSLLYWGNKTSPFRKGGTKGGLRNEGKVKINPPVSPFNKGGVKKFPFV